MQKLNTLLAALVCAVCLFSTAETLAVTRTVTSAANAGSGSLRAAIGASADGDVIVFSTLATITLTSQIEIATSLTIQGPNAAELTISGGSSARIFYVNAPGKTVTIAGIRLLNGRSQATPVLNAIVGGGAIFHSTGAMYINECEFEGNVTDDGNGSTTFGYGGAIMSQSELHVSNSLFYNNALNNNNAYGGGAVYVQDDVTDHIVSFNNVTFYNNSVVNGNAAARGGAVYISENTGSGTDTAPLVEIVNCTFYDNNANNNGEELNIFTNGPDVSITLQNNVFDRDASDGGQVSVECDCVTGIIAASNGGNIYWDTPDGQIPTNGTRDQTAQGVNGAGLTGSLALNGGGLRTIAINSAASLADDNGVAGVLVLPRDARDFTREGNPDAGAFEYDGQFTFRTLSPLDDATDIAVDANLVIGFEHPVSINSGNVAIRRVSDDILVQSIDISGGGTSEITIDPPSDLPENTELYINWPDALLTAPRGEDIADLSGMTAWSFTTGAVPNAAPTISTTNTIVSGPSAGFLSLYVDILDAETAATSLVLSVASSDISVVPTSNIVQFVPTNNTTCFRVTCADPNVGGDALVTITVSDEQGASASTTFQLSFVAPQAKTLAFSDQNVGGVDQANGGNLTIYSQQIFSLGFGTFSDAVTLQATSASVYASNLDRYGSVTMRILDSPFPSDPSKKPTITGVGGLWSAGPGVTSTSAQVRLSSTNAVRAGLIQFGWLGSQATTFTLRIVPGVFAEEGLGSLQATEVTLTINPLAPDHLAWSTTNSFGDNGFNPTDVSGFGNRFIIQVDANANRESVDISADLASFNAINGLSPVPQPTPTEYTLFTGFGGSSVTTTPPTFQPSSPTVNTSLRISMRNPVARGANLTLATTDASLSSTTVNITILTPPATQIGLSSTFGSLGGGTGAGIGNEGFNGGNFNLSASTTVNVTLSTYDDANYLTATGNNTFPVFFFTTTAVASADNSQVSLSGSAQSLTFSPLTATQTGQLNIDYVGSVVTNVTITYTSLGGLAATSVIVTLTPTSPSISDFTPKFGPVGTEVTITGANLGSIAEVLFDGITSASVTVDSDTQIRAIVPNGAATGFITVSGASGSDVSDETFGVTTSASFAVTDDAYVDSQNPTWNYGLNGSLRARLLNQTRTAYFKFAVGNITTAVVSAKLRVYKPTATSSANLLYTVSNSNQNGQPWSEGSLTFNNAPDVSGSPLASSTASAAATWLEFDVASLVNGNGSFSFALQSESETDVIYRSSESATRPELVIIDADGNDRVFLPTDDSWVNALLPFDNYGNGAAMLSRTLSREFRSYLKFNTGIVQGPVLSATLVLESRVAVSDGGVVFSTSNDLNDNSTPWTNGNIVFNNAPAPGTVQRADIGAVTVGGIELLSLAGGVNPGDNTSFVITTTSAEQANYYSSNSNGNAPELLVTWLVTNGNSAKSQGSDQVQAQSRGQFGALDVKLLPNPTDGATSILFETLSDGPVNVGIYDLRGAKVGSIHSGYLPSGPQRIDWNANNLNGAPLSNGVYLIHVATVDGQGMVNLLLQR